MRKDKPYLPLYVQDFLTDEKLINCSASAHGIYIRLLCILHKQENYGKILLKQKYKQSIEQIKNFASYINKQMPFSELEIEEGITELLDEGVICIENDYLYQKRMVNDYELSIKRANSGKEGGLKTQLKTKNFALAKVQANSDIDIDINTDTEFVLKGGVGEKFEPMPETLIGEMKATWKKHNAETFISDTDIPALLEISSKILIWMNLSGMVTESSNKNSILIRWGEVVAHCKADFHLQKYSIEQINKHFSSVTQSFKANGNTYQRNPSKSSGGRVTKSSGAEQLIESLRNDLNTGGK